MVHTLQEMPQILLFCRKKLLGFLVLNLVLATVKWLLSKWFGQHGAWGTGWGQERAHGNGTFSNVAWWSTRWFLNAESELFGVKLVGWTIFEGFFWGGMSLNFSIDSFEGIPRSMKYWLVSQMQKNNKKQVPTQKGPHCLKVNIEQIHVTYTILGTSWVSLIPLVPSSWSWDFTCNPK